MTGRGRKISSIELQNIGKVYGDTVALQPTNIVFDARKTTVLIGPSGCGKSTLLRLIVGLVEPSSGQVIFGGQVIDETNRIDLRRRVGYVIQDGGLFPHLNAQENATLMARHLRQPAADIRDKLSELCRLTHMPENLMKRFPSELSGGQRQRLSLIRALMLNPLVLLLDEPLGALDPMVRASLQAELKEIFCDLGKTVVLVTHDMAEAGYLGDVIVLLEQGRIVQKGSLEDLRDHPAEPFVSDFLSAQRSLAWL